MTDEEAEAAALSDPDARPMTPDQLRSARRVHASKPCAGRLRSRKRNLPRGITSNRHAAGLEQGRCEPDQPARAYLTAIARDPDGLDRLKTEESFS